MWIKSSLSTESSKRWLSGPQIFITETATTITTTITTNATATTTATTLLVSKKKLP